MEKQGFIYVWYDTGRKMFYIGCHWGHEWDSYICSSDRMRVLSLMKSRFDRQHQYEISRYSTIFENEWKTKHMSFPEFRTYVHKQLGLDKVNARPFEHPDAKQVFEKDGTKINHIQSKQAAIHLGKCTGAKWCTGWEGPQNMYSRYAQDGEIYHIHTNDGTHYQAHLPSHQFMDKEDNPVDPEDIAKKHPELKHFEPLNNYSDKTQDYPFKTKEEKQQIAGEKLSTFSYITHHPHTTWHGFQVRLSPQQYRDAHMNMAFIHKHGTEKQVDDMYDNIDKHRRGVLDMEQINKKKG